jgi:hypothetical protein
MADIDGDWHVTMDTPMGEQSVGLTLSTEGGELSGRAHTAFGIQDFGGGTVDGDRLAWKVTVTSPMRMELSFDATVDGDAIAGTVDAGPLGRAPFHGTRA